MPLTRTGLPGSFTYVTMLIYGRGRRRGREDFPLALIGAVLAATSGADVTARYLERIRAERDFGASNRQRRLGVYLDAASDMLDDPAVSDAAYWVCHAFGESSRSDACDLADAVLGVESVVSLIAEHLWRLDRPAADVAAAAIVAGVDPSLMFGVSSQLRRFRRSATRALIIDCVKAWGSAPVGRQMAGNEILVDLVGAVAAARLSPAGQDIAVRLIADGTPLTGDELTHTARLLAVP